MDDDGVKAAFELIQEEIGSLSRELLDDTVRLVEAGEADKVAKLMQTRKQLEDFQLRVKKLEDNWVAAFDPGTRSRTTYEPAPPDVPESQSLVLTMEYQSASARAELNGKKVTLLASSKIRKQTFGSMPEDILKLKNQAIKKGHLKDSNKPLLFELTIPLEFSSPSATAAFVAGCSVNGRKEWHVEGTGVSLRTWQQNH